MTLKVEKNLDYATKSDNIISDTISNMKGGASLNELSNIRKENNLTQEAIANKMGISKSFYSKVESGHKRPSFEFIKKLKELYPMLDANIFFTNN